jgi:DNA-binding MarR family transcriptional regulator
MSLVNALDRGELRVPRVPLGVFSKLMACLRPFQDRSPAATGRLTIVSTTIVPLTIGLTTKRYAPGMPTDRSVVLTWRSLHLADDAVRRILDERLTAEAGCSLLEHDLLAWLTAQPQRRLQMLKLADMLGVTRGGLTRIVDRLVERGWIDRDRPASNRREVYAVLTPDGQHAIEHARAIYLGALQQTLGTHLNKAELDELARITNKLLGAMAEHDPRCQLHPHR